MALVATETLSHGDELFLNYLDEQRVCPNALSNAPDWLLTPPEDNKFLSKKEFVADVPFLVQILMNIENRSKGRNFERFDARTDAELPEPVNEKKQGRIAAKLER